MQLSRARKSEGTCECASSDSKAQYLNTFSRSELDKGIELLAAPESDDIIEEAAKAFGKRHVSSIRIRSRVINHG